MSTSPRAAFQRGRRGGDPRASVVTDSVQIDEWQCHYLKDGCEGAGWYTYLLGKLTFKITERSLLVELEAARLAVRREG